MEEVVQTHINALRELYRRIAEAASGMGGAATEVNVPRRLAANLSDLCPALSGDGFRLRRPDRIFVLGDDACDARLACARGGISTTPPRFPAGDRQRSGGLIREHRSGAGRLRELCCSTGFRGPFPARRIR